MFCRFADENSPLTHKLLEKYMIINKMHRTFLERELNRTGVYRSQHQLLMHIARNPDASQKDIARIHHVSTATVAVSLKKLEKGGYISREIDQEDNRFNQIRITEKGQKIVDGSVKVFKKVEQAMFDCFEEEELEELNRYFEKMTRNLEGLFQMTSKEDLF